MARLTQYKNCTALPKVLNRLNTLFRNVTEVHYRVEEPMNRKLGQNARKWPRLVTFIDIIVFVVILALGIGGVFFFQDYLAVVSLVLSVAIAHLATIRPLLKKPRLELFVDEVRCSAPTQQGDTASWFMRLGIRNYGLTPAKQCVGRVVGIWTEQGDLLKKFDPLTLYWSRQDGTHTGFTPVDIQGYNDIEYLDIGQVKQSDLTPLTLRIVLRPPMTLSKGEDDSPSPGSNPSLRAGTYYIQVAIYADGTNIHPTWLRVSCSENISECGESVPCSIQKTKPSFEW